MRLDLCERASKAAADGTPPGAPSPDYTVGRCSLWWALAALTGPGRARGGPPRGILEAPRPNRHPRHQTQNGLHLTRTGGPGRGFPRGEGLQISPCLGLRVGQLVSEDVEVTLLRVVRGATGAGPDLDEMKLPDPRKVFLDQNRTRVPRSAWGRLGEQHDFCPL